MSFNPLQYYEFGKSRGVTYINNTFIGGVSSVITSAFDLSTKLSISESDIKNFTIVGDDIECYIGVNYNINNSGFKSELALTNLLTYYIDEGGYLLNVGDDAFFNQVNFSVFKADNLLSLGSRNFYNTNVAFHYYPNLLNIYGSVYHFYNISRPITLVIPKCLTIGNSVGSNSSFSATTVTKIYANPILQTINGGGLEGDLVGQNVNFVTDFTKPNAITDLAVNTVYATAIKLQWTEPTNLNGIDFYEIYVDGVLNTTTSNLNITILGLTNLQTYDFTVIAVDNFYNKSLVSNTVTQQINGLTNWYDDFLISYYKFENNALDSIGTNNGTPTNITYATGQVGNAAVFNGSSSKVTISDVDELSFTNGINDLPFSVSYAVKFNELTVTSKMWIFGKRTSGSLFEYQFSIYNGTCSFDIYDSVNSAYIRNNFSWTEFNTVDDFIVTHTYNGNGIGGMKTYKNGVLISATQQAIGTYSMMRNTTANLVLGARIDGANYLNGWIDEFTAWDKALSQVEVTEIYNIQNAGLELI